MKNKTISFGKLLGKILGTISIYTAIVALVISLHFVFAIPEYVQKILGFSTNEGVYYLFNKICNSSKHGYIYIYIIAVVLCLYIILWLLYVIRSCIKIKLLIIEHNSLNEVNFKIDREDLDDFAIKKYKINQFYIFNSENKFNYEEIANKAIISIKYHLYNIRKKIKKGYFVGYAGISNIPITFMLGYEIGDENISYFFHKKRINGNEKEFEVIKSEDYIEKLETKKYENDTNRQGDLVVLISLSKTVFDYQLKGIKNENDYVLKYKTKNINYDIITSTKQINDYITIIMKDIEEIQSKIDKIKICIGAPSIFIYALGTKFSKTQNKDVIVYHFEKDEYPWGINISRKTVVLNNKYISQCK